MASNRFITSITDTTCTIVINPKSWVTLVVGAIVVATAYVFGGYALFSLFQEHAGFNLGFVLLLVGLCVCSAPFVFGYKIVKHSLHEEIIVLAKGTLAITDKYIFSNKPKVFDVNSIESLTVTGSDRDFAVGGELTTVYAQAINDVLRKGAITLIHKEGNVSFGKKLASWDAEEIIEIIEGHPVYKQGRQIL